MSISTYLQKIKNVQKALLGYIDDPQEETYQNLQKILDKSNIKTKKTELKLFLYLINSISSNHHRGSQFFESIEQLLQSIFSELKSDFTSSELFQIFKENKRIILFFIKNKLITIDDSFYHLASSQLGTDINYLNYFKAELSRPTPEDYEEKRLIGENDSYICSLIRNHSVEEFITYVTKNSINLNKFIQPSIYETNSYLIRRQPSLIEYAAFFGSIEILRYLRYNNVDMNPSLWFYAIHSNNAELIHFLEENDVDIKFDQENDLIIESIKCNHNEIAEYFFNKFVPTEIDQKTTNYIEDTLKYYNFAWIRFEVDDNKCFFHLCANDYFDLVKILLDEGNIDINHTEIMRKIFKSSRSKIKIF